MSSLYYIMLFISSQEFISRMKAATYFPIPSSYFSNQIALYFYRLNFNFLNRTNQLK